MFFEKQILSNMRTAIITGHTIFNAILSSCNNDMSALQFFNYDTKIKVPPISKALTCKEIYRNKQKWHKQKWHFCQGDSSAYFLYEQFVISNGLIYIPTLSFSVLLCWNYIKKSSRPIGFFYFYGPINIILSADWSDYIKDITGRLPESFPKLYNRPIVGRLSADTSADEKWRATIGRSSADDRPTVGRHIGR